MKRGNIRRLAAAMLAFCIMATTIGTAFGAAAPSDIQGHWAEKQMAAWSDKGYLKGYDDGALRPNASISRAEFVALVNRSFHFTDQAEVAFNDIDKTHWAYGDVAEAVRAGYMEGYSDGTFGANAAITRQEIAVIVARLLQLPDTNSGASGRFRDAAKIADWSRASIGAVVDEGLMNGYAEQTFRPDAAITRAEAVVTLDRALQVKAGLYQTAGIYGPESGTRVVQGNVEIGAPGVTLRNMVIAGDLLIEEGVGDGDATLQNVTVKGTTIVRGGGENSVHFDNCILASIVVNKKNGTVRIVVEGKTTSAQTTVQSSATIDRTTAADNGLLHLLLDNTVPAGSRVMVRGVFDTIDIVAANIAVQLPVGVVNRVTVDQKATGVALSVGQDAKIVSLILHAAAKVLGLGTIEKATIDGNAQSSTFEKQPAAKDAAGVQSTATPSPSHSPTPSPTSTPTSTPTVSPSPSPADESTPAPTPDPVAAAIAAINAAIDGNNAAATLAALHAPAAGIKWVADVAAASYHAALVLAKTNKSANLTQADIQAAVDMVNGADLAAAIAVINEAIDLGVPATTLDKLSLPAGGIAGIDSANAGDYQAALGAAKQAKGSALTKADIQAAVDQVNAEAAAIAAINDAIDNNMGDSTITLTALQAQAAHIAAIVPAYADAYLGALEQKKSAKVTALTKKEIQAAVDMVNAVADINTAIDAGDETDTLAKLKVPAAGITGIVDGNAFYYQGTMALVKLGGQIEQDQIKSVVNEVNQTIAYLKAINAALSGMDAQATLAALKAPGAGIVRIDDNLANAYHQALVTARNSKGSDLMQRNIQTQIDMVNVDAVLAAINAAIDGGNAAATVAALAKLSLVVDPANANDAQDSLFEYKAGKGSDLSQSDIYAVLNLVYLRAPYIEAINTAIVGLDAATTLAKLQDPFAGITGVAAANADDYQTSLQTAKAPNVNLTRVAIQHIVNGVNAIALINQAIDAQIAATTLATLLNPAAGITGVVQGSATAYQSELFAKKTAKNAALTKSDIQAEVDHVNAIAAIDATILAGDSAATLSALSNPAARIDNVVGNYAAGYQTGLAAARSAKGSALTQAEIQNAVTVENGNH